MVDKSRFHDGKSGAALAVRVATRAPHNELVCIQNDGTLKLRLAAAPVDGKANQVLIGFLAEVLNIPQSRIDLVAGQTSRNKLITITGMTSAEVHQRIVAKIPK
jgi:hypothetical protein